MLTTPQLRRAWAPACDVPTRTIELVEGVRIRCHEAAVSAMRALGRVLEAHGYAVRQADTGAYHCRRITGGRGYSLHAYGIAVDINWSTNPYRADNVLVTDLPRAGVANVRRIRTNGGARVFRWGGDYVSVKDAMHFEIACSPAALAAGIDWRTVRQPALHPDRPHRWPLLRRGDRGRAVAELQRRLGVAGPGDPGFGHFGPRTEAAVRAYQRAHGIEVDGRVGRQTWTALLTGQPTVAPGARGSASRRRTRRLHDAPTGMVLRD
jgi:hypothetical protein